MEPLRKKRQLAQINIVPLVDVLTALIFFFLITMQFKDVYTVDITPPTMKSSDTESAVQPNVLLVKKDGSYVFNKKPIPLDEIKAQFEKISKSKNPTVLIYADAQTPLKFVADAVDSARLAKIKKVGLRAEK